jgi:uncharacterized protein YjiS (DUF1127 family)
MMVYPMSYTPTVTGHEPMGEHFHTMSRSLGTMIACRCTRSTLSKLSDEGLRDIGVDPAHVRRHGPSLEVDRKVTGHLMSLW